MRLRLRERDWRGFIEGGRSLTGGEEFDRVYPLI